MPRFTILLLGLLLSVFFSTEASAHQALACSFHITVFDADKQPIQNAQVRVLDTRSGWYRTRPANSRGHARFLGVRPDGGDLAGRGHQFIEVSAPGFETQRFEEVPCALGQRIRGRVRLEPSTPSPTA